MHSFGLTERWIVLAEFPFVVNPLRLATLGPALHRELPMEARAAAPASPCSTATTGEAKGPFTTDAVLRLPPRQRLRGRGRLGRRRHLHVPRRRHRRGPLPRPPSRRASRSPSPSCTASASTTGGAVASDELLVEEGFDLPRINYGRCNERPYRYVWGVGTDRHVLLRPDRRRSTSRAARRSSGTSPAATPASRSSSPSPAPRPRTTGVLLSVVLDADAETSFLLVLDAATLEERAARRSRTTSRSASTASSAGGRSVSAPSRRPVSSRPFSI